MFACQDKGVYGLAVALILCCLPRLLLPHIYSLMKPSYPDSQFQSAQGIYTLNAYHAVAYSRLQLLHLFNFSLRLFFHSCLHWSVQPLPWLISCRARASSLCTLKTFSTHFFISSIIVRALSVFFFMADWFNRAIALSCSCSRRSARFLWFVNVCLGNFMATFAQQLNGAICGFFYRLTKHTHTCIMFICLLRKSVSHKNHKCDICSAGKNNIFNTFRLINQTKRFTASFLSHKQLYIYMWIPYINSIYYVQYVTCIHLVQISMPRTFRPRNKKNIQIPKIKQSKKRKQKQKKAEMENNKKKWLPIVVVVLFFFLCLFIYSKQMQLVYYTSINATK